MGKEYVPDGQAKHSGDFASASTMTGALEKASTYGATIGAGVGSGGVVGSFAIKPAEGDTVLHIQDDTLLP